MKSTAFAEQDIISQFRTAMAAYGLGINDPIKADTSKIVRFTVDGDRKRSLNGWYILHTDGVPAGEFGCWKRGVQSTWCAKSDIELTEEERQQLANRRAENERLRKEEQERIWSEAEIEANTIWEAATPTDSHPYLTRKGVPSHGLRIGRWTRKNGDGQVWLDVPDALLVPIRDGKKLVSLQAIFPDKSNPSGRDKDFLSGGRKRGCLFTIGAVDKTAEHIVIVICEGYSTGASIHMATGYPVVVAFDRGNLEPVAEIIRRVYSTAEIIIAADNDRWTTKPYPNPGVRNASEAAAAVKGRMAVPDFKNLDSLPTDFNDLHLLEGLETVAAFIKGIPVPANDNPTPDVAVPPSIPAAVVVPKTVADLEQFFSGHFSVLGKCAEHRVWIRDERTGELRAFKEQELARKATLISLAPAKVWADAADAYMGEQTRFSADIGMSIVMEIAKAKPRYARPVAKAEPRDSAQLTGKHGADSAIIAKLIRDTTLYDEYSCNWYSWDTIWRKNSEGNVERTIIDVLDAAFSLEYDLGAFSGTFKLLKTRLGRSPQMTQDNSAAFDNWNRDRNLLPMRNGVLDLTTRQLIPHTPELMMSWMIPHDYSPTAKCPRIEQFLHTLAQGDEATETILLCYLAAILHGRADLQRYIEVVGMAGTGKSTFIHICEALVGSDNVMVTTMDQLHNNRFETASMFGKRLVIISDADKYGGSVEVFKAITGQDPIRYEEKNKQVGKPFIFSGMVVVAANQPLQFSDSSTAMVRRRIPVHIDKKLDKASIDPNLKDKLSEELPGLINLLLTISHDTVTSKLRDFEGARRAAEMRAMCETNTIAAWLDENCIAADVASRIGTIKNPADEFLYSNYALFCESTGRRGTLALQSFTRAVLDVLTYCGIKSDKKVTMHGKCITGLRLRTPVDSHVPSMLTGERATA